MCVCGRQTIGLITTTAATEKFLAFRAAMSAEATRVIATKVQHDPAFPLRDRHGGAAPPQPSAPTTPSPTRCRTNQHILDGVDLCGPQCGRRRLPTLTKASLASVNRKDLYRTCGSAVTLQGIAADLRARMCTPVTFVDHDPGVPYHWHAYIRLHCATPGSHIV